MEKVKEFISEGLAEDEYDPCTVAMIDAVGRAVDVSEFLCERDNVPVADCLGLSDREAEEDTEMDALALNDHVTGIEGVEINESLGNCE